MTFNLDRKGEGPVTLYLHGFGGDLHVWDRLWPHLPPGGTHIRYDLRGYGATTCKSDEKFSHAADLAALLDALGSKGGDLVGLSMGGAIALNFALDYPGRTKSLALISPGLTAWEWSDEWKSLWRPILAAARGGDMEQARRLWLAHPLFATTRASPAAALLARQIARFPGRQWLANDEAPAYPDLDRLHALGCPTLLLTGANDLPDFQLIATLLSGAVPGLTRHIHPIAGHLLPLEDPLWCARHLAAFRA